ncbi:MAG: preprotein translocase subunit SecE [Oscillospiraceae bacterium]|nr:preprotein translocase subunit SecE [Oscillospiraceae bacterium]MBR5260773.1 preprotein translocase subunit SecE [Oscillospiraceae bacterium]
MAKDEKVVASTNAVKKENKKLGFGKRVAKWFREMKSELKKVVWPTRKHIVNNTVVALVVMVLSAVVIWGFDELAQMIVKAVISIAG